MAELEDGWRYAPAAVSHMYWRRKEQFQFACDTYREWVLFAVTEGRFRYRIEERSGEAGFGDVVFCPAGAAFHREVVHPVSFHFYHFRWVPVASARGAEPRPVGAVHVLDHSRLAATYSYMEQLRAADEERRLAGVQELFRDVWGLMCLEAGAAERLSGTEAGTAIDPEMEEAALWIRRHAFEPLRMKDYSAGKRMSAVQLTRRFQAVWGQTPMEYLTSLRIERAKTLLLETRLTLDDIAVQCGYENGFYLSRVFKKKVKTAPSQYRRMHSL
ncbi:helix-turn-helix domain-containing protein [Paenibacillus chartarius]|uniref:Helix-turn-helix domain-containing protein n=1 Tax=Paenibacillus chartarius TaxID=747481 RepID=A0ABV6DR38_9BACL